LAIGARKEERKTSSDVGRSAKLIGFMALAGTLGMAGFASFPALMPAFYAE
jgi:hypothetical protein